jgi:tRNA A37 threonylcarbamoyladenosine biosynthesis protein TsaE
MKDIILISGKQGSGKTTLMNHVSAELRQMGLLPCPVIFAQTIYDIHDFALEVLRQRGVDRPGLVKDGKLLQMLGTEWGRNIDENIWVKTLLGEIEMKRTNRTTTYSPKPVFIISDCRFRNEFDGVPGALTVRLEASTEVRKERCSAWRDNDTHPSEIDLDGYAREGKFHLYLDTELDSPIFSAKKVADVFSVFQHGDVPQRVQFSLISERYYK